MSHSTSPIGTVFCSTAYNDTATCSINKILQRYTCYNGVDEAKYKRQGGCRQVYQPARSIELRAKISAPSHRAGRFSKNKYRKLPSFGTSKVLWILAVVGNRQGCYKVVFTSIQGILTNIQYITSKYILKISKPKVLININCNHQPKIKT